MISGKAFALRCQWVVDPRYPGMNEFSYTSARDSDWVFINRDYLHVFLNRVPVISGKRFFIVLHNSDAPFGAPDLQRVLPYARHVYAINTTVRHPQLTTIPIGFQDKDLVFLKTFQPTVGERDIDIYANFKVATNKEKRAACVEQTRGLPGRVTYPASRTPAEYYADLCRSKFVLCPEGTGIDTHRVYESILCGATPVVLRNSLAHLYECLPVCIVDAWTDPYTVPAGKTFPTNISAYLK